MREPIDLSRLRAALAASEFRSWNGLAQAAGVVHTTISRALKEEIRRGRQQRAGRPARRITMNPATLDGLAKALRVPKEWLTGELESLPFVPKHGILSGRPGSDAEEVTAAKVRLSHLLSIAERALQRDLRAWYGREAATAYESWGRGILLAIDDLASPVTWRLATVTLKGADPRARVTRTLLDNSAAVSWLEQALAPWFDGAVYLNARVIRELFRALYADPQLRDLTSSVEQADIGRALQQYETAATESAHRPPPPAPEHGRRTRGAGLRKRYRRDPGDQGGLQRPPS